MCPVLGDPSADFTHEIPGIFTKSSASTPKIEKGDRVVLACGKNFSDMPIRPKDFRWSRGFYGGIGDNRVDNKTGFLTIDPITDDHVLTSSRLVANSPLTCFATFALQLNNKTYTIGVEHYPGLHLEKSKSDSSVRNFTCSCLDSNIILEWIQPSNSNGV